MRLILKDKGGKNTVNQFFGSNLWVLIFLKTKEYQKIRNLLKQKIEVSLYTLDCGFKKLPFTLYTYVLAKILQNGAKFRYVKAGFKSYKNLNNFRQAVESPKSWNVMGFCPKKYISSAKTYTVDLFNTTFNYLCVDSPNYLCHLWNHKSFFTTQLLCTILAQTLDTFHKSSSSKYTF